ncbi:Mix paired-like homeobox, partial [Entomortierella lignicola]
MSSDLKMQQPTDEQLAGDTNSNNNNSSNNHNASNLLSATEQPKKAKRKRITPEQLEDLVGLFEKTDTPSFEIRESLAKKLGMTNREIQ